MTQKAAALKNRTARKLGFPLENIVCGTLAMLMELGSSAFSAAPASAALAAGLDGAAAVFAVIGGAFGSLLHGFPECFLGLGAIIVVLAARLIPDLGSAKLHAAVRCAAAVAGTFFSRVAKSGSASELLSVIVAAVSSGVFALCISLLLGSSAKASGSRLGALFADDGSPKKTALMCVACASVFMGLGALDYEFANIGRALMGFLALSFSARKGFSRSAVAVVPALCGLCLSSAGAKIGAGAAVMAVSVYASSLFEKRGKAVRAAGYVFMCAAGMIASGADEGGFRILIEAAVSGVLFAALPVERIHAPESAFSDKGVAAMIHERLNFAADAIAGIGSGISAAADVLDRKYSPNISSIADRAADRVCRSCPNSMVCWGRKYEQFHKEFNSLVAQLRTGAELTEFSLSPDCAETCVNRAGVIKAVENEYSRYVSAMTDERRVRELRRIYTDQLSGVRDILRDMGSLSTHELYDERDRSAEECAEKLLKENGVKDPQAFIVRDKSNRLRFEAYGSTEPRVPREYLGERLSGALGCDIELPEISGSNERFRITAAERTRLSAKVGAYQLSRGDNRVCGDCYDCFTGADGAFYIVLSDGMGTGSRARVDSTMACSVMSKLLKSGVALPAALETVNTVLMVKSADESFATLDICKLDLNSGECAVYKAGAAATYIKSEDRLIRASLSSPPAGTGGKLTVPAQKFSVQKGDVIVMMTDGVSPDEQWLSYELSKPSDPGDLSERIAKAARNSANGRDDDISVIAVMVGR